jgi:hypothetical protein
MSAQGKFSKEIRRNKKAKQPAADMGKVVVVWTDQTSHHIPKPSSQQGPNSLQLRRLREVRKLQKKSSKLAEAGS